MNDSELFLPLQDIFGWRARINTPGTVGKGKWTWRLPWLVEDWLQPSEAAVRARFCRQLGTGSGRTDRPDAGV
jgi:4-alpha-glucanotransferase